MKKYINLKLTEEKFYKANKNLERKIRLKNRKLIIIFIGNNEQKIVAEFPKKNFIKIQGSFSFEELEKFRKEISVLFDDIEKEIDKETFSSLEECLLKGMNGQIENNKIKINFIGGHILISKISENLKIDENDIEIKFLKTVTPVILENARNCLQEIKQFMMNIFEIEKQGEKNDGNF